MFVIQLLTTAVVALVGARVMYNLFFHPLRKYPGPLISRATPLPRIFHRINGTAVYHIQNAHDKYGTIVRISPSELSYIRGDAWKDIYGHLSTLTKDTTHNPTSKDMVRGMFEAIDPENHDRQRQIFNPAFSTRALRSQEPVVTKHIRNLLSKLHVSCTENEGNVNMVDQLHFLAFDLMADVTFGKQLRLLDTSEYQPWIGGVTATFKLLTYRSIIGYYLSPAFFLILGLISRQLIQRCRAHFAYSAALVNERLAAKPDCPDIWTFVIRDRESDTPKLKMDEVHVNGTLFMAAGTETTATALAGILWNLAKHPHSLKRLREEIQLSFKSQDDFTMEKLARLPFLDAVISETLRLHPPNPEPVVSRLIPPEGVQICGAFVPGGCLVSVHQWAAYRSPRNFHLPNAFLPERWLPEAKETPAFAGDDKAVLQPFSVGPRSCIGRNLALLEIRLTVCHIIWNFDLSLKDESTNWDDQKVWALWEQPPLNIRLTPVCEQ